MIEQIQQKINICLNQLYENEIHLLKNNASERSIVHHFAKYLSLEFQEYDIDVEYNLNFQNDRDRKEIHEIEQRLTNLRCNLENRRNIVYNDDIYYVLSVYPDIIVHKRRSNEDNLLAIEVKKSTNNNRQLIEFDKFKLEKYTSNDINNQF